MLIILSVCVAVDDASTSTEITNKEKKMNSYDDIVIVNESDYIHPDENVRPGVAETDGKIYTVKQNQIKRTNQTKQTITITSKPSCGCNHGYYWHTKTFVNYCPNCGHYSCLVNKHKWSARYEQELTCSICDSDFCGCCGKEKESWSHVYLRKP